MTKTTTESADRNNNLQRRTSQKSCHQQPHTGSTADHAIHDGRFTLCRQEFATLTGSFSNYSSAKRPEPRTSQPLPRCRS